MVVLPLLQRRRGWGCVLLRCLHAPYLLPLLNCPCCLCRCCCSPWWPRTAASCSPRCARRCTYKPLHACSLIQHLRLSGGAAAWVECAPIASLPLSCCNALQRVCVAPLQVLEAYKATRDGQLVPVRQWTLQVRRRRCSLDTAAAAAAPGPPWLAIFSVPAALLVDPLMPPGGGMLNRLPAWPTALPHTHTVVYSMLPCPPAFRPPSPTHPHICTHRTSRATCTPSAATSTARAGCSSSWSSRTQPRCQVRRGMVGRREAAVQCG